MSLRKSLLAFLSSGPSSGYDLAREFSETVGGFWYASHSQIYPELRRLEGQGLVRSDADVHDGRLRKRVYHLTDDGWAAVREWLESPPAFSPERDLAGLQILLADVLSIDAIRSILGHYRDHYELRRQVWQAQLDQLRAGTHPRLAMRRATLPDVDGELMTGLKEFVLVGQVERSELELMWADRLVAWLDEVEPRRHGDVAAGVAPTGSSPP